MPVTPFATAGTFSLHPLARTTRLVPRNGDCQFRFNLIFRRGYVCADVRAVPSRSGLLAHRTDIPSVLSLRRRGAGYLGGDVRPGARLRTAGRHRQPDPSPSDMLAGVASLASSWPTARFSGGCQGHPYETAFGAHLSKGRVDRRPPTWLRPPPKGRSGTRRQGPVQPVRGPGAQNCEFEPRT